MVKKDNPITPRFMSNVGKKGKTGKLKLCCIIFAAKVVTSNQVETASQKRDLKGMRIMHLHVLYNVFHQLSDLGWVDLDLEKLGYSTPQSCPPAQPFLPKSSLP